MSFNCVLCDIRLKKGKQLRKVADIKEVKESIHLIKPAAGMLMSHSIL